MGKFVGKNSGVYELSELDFHLVQDGDVGVGILPETHEVFVGGESADARSIGIRAVSGLFRG